MMITDGHEDEKQLKEFIDNIKKGDRNTLYRIHPGKQKWLPFDTFVV